MPAQSVYVVIATAVYDHGVVGVYLTREEATAATEDQWRHSDGHHAFRVEEIQVGATYDVYPRFHYSDEVPTEAEPRVEFVPEQNRTRWAGNA